MPFDPEANATASKPFRVQLAGSFRGAVRDEHLARRAATRLMERSDHHQAGQLALRSCRGLQTDAVHADDLGQDVLEAHHQLERALGKCSG
jgi:hypothetical protein